LVLGAVDLQVLLTGDGLTGSLPIGLPTIGLRLRLDSLSAFFGVVINGGVLAARSMASVSIATRTSRSASSRCFRSLPRR